MRRAQLITALAKVAVATAFGGPLGGSRAAANQAVELLSGWVGNGGIPTYESTLGRIRAGLEQFAYAERIDYDQVEQALSQARDIVLTHGLDSDGIASLDLIAERVTGAVLARAASELNDMDEAARSLCHTAIRTVYSSMLSTPAALPELQRAFQRAVLARMTELRGQPNEVVGALKAALGRATIDIPRLEWHSELYSANALLRPEFAVVPFYGRAEVLSDLVSWAESDRPLSVRLYTGAGGMGKTRLMIQACNRLSPAWRAGFLNQEIGCSGWWLPLDAVFERRDRLFVVVDYAETRASEVQALVRRSLTRTTGQPVRVLLLARAVGDWWSELKTAGQGVGDVLAGPATTELPLAPVARLPEQRGPLFESAASAFAAVLPESTIPATPPLDAGHYDRVLYVLLTALAAVQGEMIKEEKELLDFAQRREQKFLDDGIVAAGYGNLRGRPILQCAAVATLAGRAGDRGEAVRLIAAAPLLQGQPSAVVDSVAELLHRLYPGEAWLQGMQPDVLGEHLVERALEEDLSLIGAAFGRAG